MVVVRTVSANILRHRRRSHPGKPKTSSAKPESQNGALRDPAEVHGLLPRLIVKPPNQITERLGRNHGQIGSWPRATPSTGLDLTQARRPRGTSPSHIPTRATTRNKDTPGTPFTVHTQTANAKRYNASASIPSKKETKTPTAGDEKEEKLPEDKAKAERR